MNRIKGITLTNSGKYRTRVYKDNKEYTVGTFSTITEAIQERNKFIENL